MTQRHDASDPSCGCTEVCSLPPATRDERIAMIRRDILPLATRREALANGVAYEFPGDPEIETMLREFVAFERECCSGLDWDVQRSGVDGLRFTVEGLPADSPVFAAVDPKPEASAAPAGGRAARAAKALGFGTLGAFLVCCVAPGLTAFVLGAAVAAPLAKLDAPVPILAGALLLAIPAWRWLGRPKEEAGACSAGSCNA